MKWMLVLMSLCAFSVQAKAAEFVMSEPHCAVLKQHAIQAITAKTAGVQYPQYVRERVEGYGQLTGIDRVVYLNILPYSLEMAYEYFNSDFNPTTPYEEVIERHCLEKVGSSAE